MESLMNLRMTYPQFLKYILPSILSAAAISFFTTIDGFFVSRYVGPDPLAAINIVIPYCKRQIIVDEKLLLKGLMILYRKNS